jgi:hypothetical protein
MQDHALVVEWVLHSGDERFCTRIERDCECVLGRGARIWCYLDVRGARGIIMY